MIDEIIGNVKSQLPKFNNDIIINLRKKEVNELVDFVAEMYRECAIVADENLEYIGVSILSPQERLLYELSGNSQKKKNNINIKDDEAVLAVYSFKYYDQIFKVPLYIPYIYEDGCFVVKNVRHEPLLNMTEKLFSVRSGQKGVTIKVIRSPISFYKNSLHPFIDEVTGEQFVGSIVSCKIHYKKMSKTKKIRPTVINYLLCKFTLQEMLAKFSIDPEAMKFVDKEPFEEGWCYIKIKNTASDQIYIKANRNLLLTNHNFYDIVGTVAYILHSFRFITLQELISDSRTIFMVILGKLIHNINTNRVHALSHMVRHIESVDTYLDSYTRKIFQAEGITVNNIYDLFCFLQVNISKIVIDYPNNNMYNKRIEAVRNVIVDGLVKTINLNIYGFERKNDFGHMFKSISRAFSVHPKLILRHLGRSESVRFSSSGVYGDNWLLALGNKIIKRLSAATKSTINNGASKDKKNHSSGINAYVNKFHPSMLVVESAIGFSSKPGSNCLVNPYTQIDLETGGFIRLGASEEIALIQSYLTNDQKGIIEDLIDDDVDGDYDDDEL